MCMRTVTASRDSGARHAPFAAAQHCACACRAGHGYLRSEIRCSYCHRYPPCLPPHPLPHSLMPRYMLNRPGTCAAQAERWPNSNIQTLACALQHMPLPQRVARQVCACACSCIHHSRQRTQGRAAPRPAGGSSPAARWTPRTGQGGCTCRSGRHQLQELKAVCKVRVSPYAAAVHTSWSDRQRKTNESSAPFLGSSLFWWMKPGAVCITFCSAAILGQPCDRGSSAGPGSTGAWGACLARPLTSPLAPASCEAVAAVAAVEAAGRRARSGRLPRAQGAQGGRLRRLCSQPAVTSPTNFVTGAQPKPGRPGAPRSERADPVGQAPGADARDEAVAPGPRPRRQRGWRRRAWCRCLRTDGELLECAKPGGAAHTSRSQPCFGC